MFLKAFLVLEWFLSIQQRAVVGVGSDTRSGCYGKSATLAASAAKRPAALERRLVFYQA